MNKKTITISALTLGALFFSFRKKSEDLNSLAINASLNAFGDLDNEQIDSIQEIVKAFNTYGDGDGSKLAYILATAWHESRFRPIKEYRGAEGSAHYYQQNTYWYTGYYGRGFVQLTHLENYQKMSNFLGLDLVSNPDLALQKDVAAKILVYGMINGSFTRRKQSEGGAPYKLSDFIGGSTNDFYNARRVVNHLDKALLINDYAIAIVNYNS